MKTGFILHLDSLAVLDELTNEQAGILFKAIRDYNLGKEPELDFAMKIAFLPFKNQFVRDFEKNKRASIAQAYISTFQSAVDAFLSLAKIPVVGPYLGGVAAAAAIALYSVSISVPLIILPELPLGRESLAAKLVAFV